MVISRTPFRVSLFGGGTDYPIWYRENPGAVLATSVDKYCYVFCRYLPPFFEHKHHIVYRQIELPQTVEEIQHPVIREALKFLEITEGVSIHHTGDLPARAGMGTSSSFTVSLLHALYALKGITPTTMRLAQEAIHIEQEIIRENVGSQDQVTAAFGGLNRIDFRESGIQVTPVLLKAERLEQLQNSLMIFFTGFSRTASQIAGVQIKETPNRKAELSQMYQMVGEAVLVLQSSGNLTDFGKLLGGSWKLKRSLTGKISNPYIDYAYEAAIKAGATGGKLIGAGGGGFLLFFVEPDLQPKVREALKGLLEVPFRFETGGSRIIFDGG